LRRLLCISYIVILCSACNKVPDYAHKIPEDAELAAVLNLKKIGRQISWNKISGGDFFSKKDSSIDNDFLNDIQNSGLDLNCPFFLFTYGMNAKARGIYALAKISDSLKFDQWMHLQYPKVETKSKHGFQFFMIDQGQTTFAIKNKNLICCFEKTAGKKDEALSFDAEKQIETIYNLPDSNSLTKKSYFKNFLAESSDIGILLNNEQRLKNARQQEDNGLSSLKGPAEIKNKAMSLGINFKKGSLDLSFKSYLSKKLLQAYRRNQHHPVNPKLYNKLGDPNLCLLSCIHLNPKLLLEQYGEGPIGDVMNLLFKNSEANKIDLEKSFNGELALAMTDFAIEETSINENNTMGYEPKMNYILIAGIQEKNRTQKLLKAAISEKLLTKKGGSLAFVDNPKNKLSLHNKFASISNSDSLRYNYIKRKGQRTKLPKGTIKHFKHDRFALYAHIGKMINAFPRDGMDEKENEVFQNLQNTFTYVSIWGGETTATALSYKGQIFFKNKNENSLLQLIQIIKQIEQVEQVKEMELLTPSEI